MYVAEDQTNIGAESKYFWIRLFSYDRCVVNLRQLKAEYMSWREKKIQLNKINHWGVGY